MKSKLEDYVNFIFRNAPNTCEAMELKREIESNVIDKYNKLTAEGLDEQQAFSKAIASIGNIDELLNELKRSSSIHEAQNENGEEKKTWRLLRSFLKSLAIMLFIVSPFMLILLSETKSDELGLAVMFLCIAAGVGIFVFLNSFEAKKNEDDENDIPQSFSEYKNRYKPKRRLFRKIKSFIWSCTILLYVLISFITMRWHVTWLIFIIAGITVSLLDIAMDED